MSKVIGGLIVVAGIWVGVEFVTQGPSRAFDGAFASFFSGTNSSVAATERRSTAQRAGDAARVARDEAEARRERMLAE